MIADTKTKVDIRMMIWLPVRLFYREKDQAAIQAASP
jgi:hypothetical protein